MTDKKALKLALEALLINCGGNTEGIGKEAITACEQALAAPVQPVCPACESIEWEGQPCQICQPTPEQPAPMQEPVGEVNRYGLDSHGRKWHGIHWYDPNVDVAHGTKLYTTPPAAQPAPVQEPVAFDDWPQYHEHAMGCGLEDRGITDRYDAMRYGWDEALERAWEAVNLHGPLYTTPPAAQRQRMSLTERELELIDGMIAVQLDHAARCDSIANRTMAEKQKGWDMERVALLQKLKENT